MIVTRFKHGGIKQTLISCQTEEIQNNIRKYAQWLGDEQMLTKIQDADFIANEVQYHRLCRLRYQKKASSTPAGKNDEPDSVNCTEKNMWHHTRQVHSLAFEAVCSFVDHNAIQNKEVHLLCDLNNLYQAALYEIGGIQFEDITTTTQKLEVKLVEFYGEKIKIHKGSKRKGNIIYSAELDPRDVLQKEVSWQNDMQMKVRDVAFSLRQSIMS